MTEKIDIKVLRNPVFPVIIISKAKLYSSRNPKSLALRLLSAQPLDGEDSVQIIDNTGEEFCYYQERQCIIFTINNIWTKKRIIDLFNESANAKEVNVKYPAASLSNKKLSKIISDICVLIEYSNKQGTTDN
ncbi:MAG: hypothetical protein E3K37_17270 [Candidatus Kuenenia sp.]|nr:hypothetical protein [Candidatus Kuenenia hertensis]